MNKNTWKKLGITAFCTVAGIYILFLILPLVINPIINNYSPQIVDEIKKVSGLEAKLEGVKLVTTPKLTAGIKVRKFELLIPKEENILSAQNFQVKMSLLPLIAKRIEIDAVQLEEADINIKINKDGTFEVEKYLPQNETQKNSEEPVNVEIPFKLSNYLPDIKVGNYKLTITDGIDNYVLSGEKTEVTDFILDKSIKIKAAGKAVLKDREQFNYDIKIFNKIMPDLELNELVFNPQESEEINPEESDPIDIIAVLQGIYNSKITANINSDLKIEHDNINGYANLTNLSIMNLPASNANLKFKGKNININSDIYTSKNEVSKLNGTIESGKRSKIDMNFKSDIEISNILKIIKEIALVCNINDLQTLNANGRLNADFNIKSDLKTVKSSGYLKIPAANIFYGLYNIGVDNINADVALDNNNINIKNIGFSVFNQPLKIFGTISETAVSDLHITADKLSLKGLLVAFGQAGLMKENQINSGLISMNADIKGKLDKINPEIKLSIDNIDIKNIPSNTVLKAPLSIVNISGVNLSGTAESKNIKVINPAASISIPQISANINENEIEITQTPVTIEKIHTAVSGKIKNYLTENIGLNFVTTGDIKSTLNGDMNVNKQTLNLVYATSEPSTIVVPMFDKSKMTFSTNLAITGSMLNPILKGIVSVPNLNIPEIPVTITNLDAKVNGKILHGSGSVQKFTSGGIEAENLTGDFELAGNNFYLKNLKGDAFGGKIYGNIIYNIVNAKTSVDFAGEGLDAEKAIYGGAGIKNALSGTLGFKTKLNLVVLDYNDMMRSMKGNLSFQVKNGAFGSIGRIDNFFKANNIVNNSLLKTTVNTITNSAGLADAAKFEYIEGNLNFSDGWAILNPVKSSGTSLAYYITGKFNLINGTTNVNILGRLDAPIVAKLGPVGQLSADKLLSYIPKFGSMTANIVNALTENPKGENVAAIPALTNGNTNYKDFKVVFNGGLESTSSIKSFKWLTDVDMSAIETKSVKETLNEIKSSVNTDLNNTVKNVTDAITGSKEQWNTTKDQLKDSANELKNLFKGLK